MTEVNPVLRDAFDSFAIVRRTHTGQKSERADVDAEDWLDCLAELANDAQNRAVAASYDQQICHRSELRHRVAQLFSSDTRRFFLEQGRNREPLEFLGNLVDELRDTAFSRVSYEADRFRMHAKNSWFPSAPLIEAGAMPVTTCPTLFTKATILSCAIWCNRGSRTMPPFPTSERSSSNCGLMSPRITPLGFSKANAFGRMRVREMKETSIAQISIGSETCSSARNRALIFSKTITRGSLRSFQSS